MAFARAELRGSSHAVPRPTRCDGPFRPNSIRFGLPAQRRMPLRSLQSSPPPTAMTIKTNPLHAAVAAGRLQIGTWINLTRNPAILTLLKSAGLDYARVDMEHSSPSIETVADMAALARALNFPLVVRPPEGNREWITRLLDNGVWGLHIPQVDTPEIAHTIVE